MKLEGQGETREKSRITDWSHYYFELVLLYLFVGG